MKLLGVSFRDFMRVEWLLTRSRREMLYGTPDLWKRIRYTHGPGGMGFLLSVVQLGLECGSECAHFIGDILRGLAFSLSSIPQRRPTSPEAMPD